MKILKTANYKEAQIPNVESVFTPIFREYVKQLAEMGNSLGEAVVKGKISKEEAWQRLEEQSKTLVKKVIDEKIQSLTTIGQDIRQDIDTFEQTHP